MYLPPREWHRSIDEFLRLITIAKTKKLMRPDPLEWAFKLACQNVYYDLFPQEFFDETGIDQPMPMTANTVLPQDSADHQYIAGIRPYHRAYMKIARGIDSGKPLLLVKDMNSYDTAEIVTDIYVRQQKGTMVRVPITPFSDRTQIVGAQIPKEILSDTEVEDVLKDATEYQIRHALAVIKNKINEKTTDLSEERIGKLTHHDYEEWKLFKDSHGGVAPGCGERDPLYLGME